MSESTSFKSLKQNGSDLNADHMECMVSVKCGAVNVEDEINFEGEISFESRQDQLCVECKAHVEQGSSLLVGSIAASLIMTRAMPRTSASTV